MELMQLLLDESKLLDGFAQVPWRLKAWHSFASEHRLDRLTQTAKELSAATGRTCIPTQADVRQPQTLQAAVAKTIERFGKIDFVICGRWISSPCVSLCNTAPVGAAGNFLAPISGVSENAFRTVVEIDTVRFHQVIHMLTVVTDARDASDWHIQHGESYSSACSCFEGLLYPCQCDTALQRYVDLPFIIPSQDIPCHVGTPYQVHVSAAKAGVDALSAVLAVEEGPHGVRSNVIAPGPIAGTEGVDRLSPKGDTGAWASTHPTGRMGDVKDIANATIFLFSDAAAYITGQVLPVDGGNEHLRTQFLPYPKALLDPASVQSLIRAKM